MVTRKTSLMALPRSRPHKIGQPSGWALTHLLPTFPVSVLLFNIHEFDFVILYCRNVIPSTGSHSSASFPLQPLELDGSCRVSVDAAHLSVMSPVPGSDAVAHCSSSIKTVTSNAVLLTLSSNESVSSGELNRSGRAVHLSRDEMASAGNACKTRRSHKQLSPKTRVRRTQLKMLADNLSKFYAPSTGGNRRELLARKRNVMLTERSARERQLEVIRKQMSLVEKRKKAELEVAAAASHSDARETDSRSVCSADTVSTSTDSVSKRKSATVRFNAHMNRKLGRWKYKRRKYFVHHKQKSSHGSTEFCEAELPSHSESM